ncbi:MAG: hypothetical protein WAQ57_03880 [Candidatus Saccharimonadales bacterium]
MNKSLQLAIRNLQLAKNAQFAISYAATNGQSPMANVLPIANRQSLIAPERSTAC